MSTPAAAAITKAAPKTYNQLRNALYFSAAIWGFLNGRYEKLDNDKIWEQHQLKVWAQDYQKKEAEKQAKQAAAQSQASIPDIIPEDLHEVYKEFTKA